MLVSSMLPRQIARGSTKQGPMAPHQWWSAYGSVYPTLQPIAVKILAKQPSASPCERNWSDLEITVGKRRCSFKSTTLGKVLSVRQNLKNIKADDDAGDKGTIYDGLLGKPLKADDEAYMVEAEEGGGLEDADDAAGAAIFLREAEVVDLEGTESD